MSSWLPDAIIYQIYPQSFADSDGDGIGDLPGIIDRLDYLSWLGVTALWLNPCFSSPFGDAGYDVADYLTVARRYGTNEDLAALTDQAARRGIRVLLDLVPGHTSDQHPWFTRSASDPGDHRYIWAPDPLPAGFVPSPGARPGGFLPNFFPVQPALNYGYARPDPGQPWRQQPDDEGPRANRAALRDIMSHWLSLGVSGFRVDMAASLVKDDPDHSANAALWTQLRGWLDQSHPDAALISEWGDPVVSVPAGFHADFFLQFGGPTQGRPFRSLFNNRQGTDSPGWDPVPCYFDASGTGTARIFVEAWAAAVQALRSPGHIALPTANHDFSRLNCGRDAGSVAGALVLVLTWPAIPAIYYGDEIGMRYIPDFGDVEGSVMGPHYNRAGSRTPMQWQPGPGAGFSTAPQDRFYLPLDPDPHRPDVASQRADSGSLLSLTHELIRLRRAHPELGTGGSVEVLSDGYPLVYLRGGRFLVVVNPSGKMATVTHGRPGLAGASPVVARGVTIGPAEIVTAASGYGVFRL